MAGKKIRVLGKGQLTIGKANSSQPFDADVTKVTLTPKTDSTDPIEFLDGHHESDSQTNWTLDGTIKENYSATGLQAWCYNHAGEEHPFTFTPNTAGELSFHGTVLVAPIAIGGDVKKQNDQDFSFTVSDIQLELTQPAPGSHDVPAGSSGGPVAVHV